MQQIPKQLIMIRSSKLSIKFANKIKKDQLIFFIEEYKLVISFFIDQLWNLDEIPKLIPKEITSKVGTWLSARAIQCAAKQASGIVRGTRTKQKKREFIYNKLLEQGCFKKARKLKAIIDKVKVTKPKIKYINPELDSRFVTFDFDNPTSFDGWVIFSSLGNKLKIKIPIKKSKHFNSMEGKLKLGVRLSRNGLTFMFEKEVESRNEGKILGLDIGVNTVASTSDDQITRCDIHGYDLAKINVKLSRKKKGSKSFRRTQVHRKQYINWSINQLNFDNIKTLILENIKNLRRGKRSSRYLNHWTYTEIKDKLEQTFEKLGVQVEYVNPTYTSQRCSSCGWVRRNNRKGKLFKCGKCGFALDADLNGSRNIVANLRTINKKERQLHKNRIGFYWHEVGQESIVPNTH